MEITTGLLITIFGGAGVLVFLALFIASKSRFKKQRKRLLAQIEEE